MRSFLCLAAIMVVSPASASGGLHCSADDEAVIFEVEGGVTHGMGGPLFSFRGEVDIKNQTVAGDLRNTNFARENVAQYWLDGEELRLLLYRERGSDKAHGYVQLLIETKARGDDEGSYGGRYALSVLDMEGATAEGTTFDVAGEVVCSAE